jgi:hypothetical protein
MSNPLLPTRFLFQFSVPCRYRDPLWTDKGANLDETYRLVSLADLEERPALAEVRAAWSEAGLVFVVHARGKHQPPWCRAARPEDSDGLQLWIDTRDVHNVHRAGRFCHRFLFLPTGAGRNLDQPVTDWQPINRSKERPVPVRPEQLHARSRLLPDGYILEAMIPAEALTGFDPAEYPRLGFTYAVIDRELGEQTFGVGSPMPYQEDPSLWATLELKGIDEG